jgi:hypothetical protein
VAESMMMTAMEWIACCDSLRVAVVASLAVDNIYPWIAGLTRRNGVEYGVFCIVCLFPMGTRYGFVWVLVRYSGPRSMHCIMTTDEKRWETCKELAFRIESIISVG